jgi:HrpA-like RNA helicase
MNLPIQTYKNEIVSTVRSNPVTIITAETGAGKSTQVPQFLLAEGYNLVVTQPRRLAARSVASRVAFELGEELGNRVGVRTRDDRVVGPNTRCLFATDGLALVRELFGAGRHNLLVLDEVHEWNLNIEVLVAWAKLQINRGANFKLALMSATIEAERLARFFGNAPVIEVPGRLFPVEERQAGRDIATDAIELLKKGRNVLVFQPGKAEITQTIDDLAKSGVRAEILPLHGELTPEEQAKCFKHYGRPKCIVSTNVAQTSVTIDDIDAVIDCGKERRIELSDGVEGLYVKSISLADSAQRKGRAGRTKEGIYIDHCPDANRPEFPVAEILRSRLDQTVLRLAEAGFDAEELEFFHQPDRKSIHDARVALKALGCMDAKGQVTRKGHQVATMPISVEAACMVLKADELGVVDDVLTIAAILEVGDLTARKDEQGTPSFAWMKLVEGEVGSDVIAQLRIYNAALGMKRDELRKRGVHAKNFFKAKEVRRHLVEALRGKIRDFRSSGIREDILKSVCAGMVSHVYQRYNFQHYVNGDGLHRQLNRDSVVAIGAEWLVARPKDLEIQTRYGMRVLNLIHFASVVRMEWLLEIAPQLFTLEEGLDPRYSSEEGLTSSTVVRFRDVVIECTYRPDPNHPLATRVFGDWLRWQYVPLQAPPLREVERSFPEVLVQPFEAPTGTRTAYGALSWSSYSYTFVARWYTDKAEAERVHADAKEVFLRQRASSVKVETPRSLTAPIAQHAPSRGTTLDDLRSRFNKR